MFLNQCVCVSKYWTHYLISCYFLGELFTSAADLATEAMKGKLASKYYMQAEEAWAECEE